MKMERKKISNRYYASEQERKTETKRLRRGAKKIKEMCRHSVYEAIPPIYLLSSSEYNNILHDVSFVRLVLRCVLLHSSQQHIAFC
jgi:hypothetical protein